MASSAFQACKCLLLALSGGLSVGSSNPGILICRDIAILLLLDVLPRLEVGSAVREPA